MRDRKEKMKEINEKYIKKRLVKMYHNNEEDLTRELVKIKHDDTCFYLLEGSPPKGYAVYIPEHNKIVFIDAWGDKKTTKDTV